MTTPAPDNRPAWLALFQRGYAGRPGNNPGQPFAPGPVTGGANGPTIHVNTRQELLAAAAAPGPAWIIAGRDAGGRLSDRMIVSGDKTIIAPDGVEFYGRGIRIDRAMNVAIHGVAVWDAIGDGIEISESRVVALHDCLVNGFTDGGLDIVRGSTDVSVIDCLVTGGEKGCLIGADDRPHGRQFSGALGHLGRLDDRQTRVTMIGCTFNGVKVRAPLVRHGRVLLRDHRILGGGKGPLVEARTNAQILWESGSVVQTIDGRPVEVATHRGPDAKLYGKLYIGRGVDLGGSTAATNWRITAREALEMGVGDR